MRVEQFHLKTEADHLGAHFDADLVLIFGSTHRIEQDDRLSEIRESFAGSLIVGCTTSGEITASGVSDESITVTSMKFDSTSVRAVRQNVPSMDGSFECGQSIAQQLAGDDLKFVLVLSDGLGVNGSSLVSGLRSSLPADVPFSGGLAGDAARFSKTLTFDSDGTYEHAVIAVGFYGNSLSVSTASRGGWAPFGAKRTVTRATDNVVFEIDGARALDIYKSYLGDEADNLPASGLLFPLALSPDELGDQETGLIRTLLAIDEETGSLTFAGDVPEGTQVQLMHADYDELVEGAETAASACTEAEGDDLVLLVSCVGRKLLLGNNIDFEVEAVSDTLGEEAVYTGFYSYGEIGPYEGSGVCELHNQTMTIAVLSEG